jgi:hypothetical protein
MCRCFSSSIKERSQISSLHLPTVRSQTMKTIRSAFFISMNLKLKLFLPFASPLQGSVCVMCFLLRILLIFQTVFCSPFSLLSMLLQSKPSRALELRSHKINFYLSWQKLSFHLFPSQLQLSLRQSMSGMCLHSH